MRPLEPGIEVEINPSGDVLTLTEAYVDVFVQRHLKKLADMVDDFLIFAPDPGSALDVPEAVIEVEFGPLHQCQAREGEDVIEVGSDVLTGEVIFVAVDGEVDLPNGAGAQEGLKTVATQVSSVGRQMDRSTFLFADAKDLRKFRMRQRLTHEVQADLFRVRQDLAQNLPEVCWCKDLLVPFDFRTEGALEITDVRNLNVGP